jgi:hypothetical protein
MLELSIGWGFYVVFSKVMLVVIQLIRFQLLLFLLLEMADFEIIGILAIISSVGWATVKGIQPA